MVNQIDYTDLFNHPDYIQPSDRQAWALGEITDILYQSDCLFQRSLSIESTVVASLRMSGFHLLETNPLVKHMNLVVDWMAANLNPAQKKQVSKDIGHFVEKHRTQEKPEELPLSGVEYAIA